MIDRALDLIERAGAWVTSPPGAKNVIRFEVSPGSSLIEMLASIGYSPRHVGEGERIMLVDPEVISNSKGEVIRRVPHAAPRPVRIYELRVPPAAPARIFGAPVDAAKKTVTRYFRQAAQRA
jgi:hypothetical protein